MSTIRRQIVDAVAARFATIPGFTRCDIWRRTPYAPTELPALYLADTTDAVTVDGVEDHQHAQTIEAVLMVSGSVAPSQARDLANMVYEAIGTDETWGGLALYTVPGQINLDSEVVGDAVSAASLSFTVVYLSTAWKG